MKTLFTLLIGLLILTTGCIELKEKISVNKDKSGSISYTLKADQISGLLQSLSGFIDASHENKIKNEAGQLAKKLKTKKGISNVRFNFDKKTGNYLFSFDFADSKKLNAAIYELGGSKKRMFYPSFLKVKRKRVKKINYAPWVKKYLEKEKIDFPSNFLTNMVSFKASVKVPTNIKKVSGENHIISKDNKTVIQTFDLPNIIDNKANVKVKVRY